MTILTTMVQELSDSPMDYPGSALSGAHGTARAVNMLSSAFGLQGIDFRNEDPMLQVRLCSLPS
jgi:hypothetical protein